MSSWDMTHLILVFHFYYNAGFHVLTLKLYMYTHAPKEFGFSMLALLWFVLKLYFREVK